MTDAHYHRDGYATFLTVGGREFRFYGVHPWEAARAGRAPYQGGECAADASARRPYQDGEFAAELRAALEADAHAGVGEIGLDRLKNRVIDPAQRAVFAAQLEVAAEFHRPVVLHGAKCWGEVVAACRPYAGRIPAFLFHGFSRSAGLLPQIYAMNGFVSIGPALLNDHAVNYRAMAAGLPLERILVETDAEWDDVASHEAQIRAIVDRLARLRDVPVDSLADSMSANLARFLGPSSPKLQNAK